jgi:hypothetical protein
VAALVASPVCAGNEPVSSQIKPGAITQIKLPPPKADLAVIEVQTLDCACRDCLYGNGLMYPAKIRVQVQNFGPNEARGVVSFSYKLANHNLKSFNKGTRLLKKGETQWLEMFTYPVMVYTNPGLKAVIKVNTAGVTDPNSANNTAVNKTCLPLVK